MSRPAPPMKSWAQVVKATKEPEEQAKGKEGKEEQDEKEQAPSTTPVPQPRVQPKEAKELPPRDSTRAVQPCFQSLAQRGYPLGFPSRQSFEACMQHLCEEAWAAKIDCEVVGVRGSAATYVSGNPHKEEGHHFDRDGKYTSDIDAFVVVNSRLTCRPNEVGFFHPRKVAEAYPSLRNWGKAWSKKLNRKVTPAAHTYWAPALDEDYIEYACDCGC